MGSGADAYVVPASDAVRGEAYGIVSMLRDSGISSDMDLMGRKMAKAMKHASSVGAGKVIIVGEKELSERSVTVRDMSSGDQTLIRISELVRYLS